jgi:hypothetical protein
MEDAMRDLRSEVVGDRRVALVEHDDGRYDVTIAVRTIGHDWEDISSRADAGLTFHVASRRYRQHVAGSPLGPAGPHARLVDLNVECDDLENALRDAAHDAFMTFWRGRETADAEALWRAYCTAQAHYETYLMAQPCPAVFTDMKTLSD